ncbi:MAG TPA: hypothetical protein VN238_21540 [Solirubrobacteraceae bacterium]|nr:hypothetical protein [Solirubrobacteraceae bacterium]
MRNVLVVANRTVAGRSLLEAVRQRHEQGDHRFHLVVPLAQPKHGNVIYDEAERDAARLRVDLVTAYLAREGIKISGEVGDEDPYSATTDALASFPADEIIVSTLPQTRSGWLRRDLVDRIRDAADGRPVEHVVTDLQSEGLAVGVTLVVANKTAGGDELLELLKRDAEQQDRVFIAVMPLDGREGRHTGESRARLSRFIDQLRENGITASGMLGDPDPYDAVKNALSLFTVDHVIISTLPGAKSGWLRADLVDRVRNSTAATVDHVEVALEGVPA